MEIGLNVFMYEISAMRRISKDLLNHTGVSKVRDWGDENSKVENN